jgi:predicted regulator of Ras-like GTPase activity (Roadblock/LC7/MglB family)
MSDNLHLTEEQSIRFRSGFSIFPSQMAIIDRHLNALLEAIPARLILMVDTSGQLVTSAGETREIDPAALGSLIAGDLAASHEIAKMTGEFQEFQTILREGERSNIIISEAGQHLIFLVQFAREVPLGWARKLIQKTAYEIDNISINPIEESAGYNTDLESNDLPDLFSDALDDIWKG